MKFPGVPENEEERLKSLYLADLLDTRDDERFERLTRLAKKFSGAGGTYQPARPGTAVAARLSGAGDSPDPARYLFFAPTPSCRTRFIVTMRSMTIVL